MEHRDKENNTITKDTDTVDEIIAVRFKGNQKSYHFKTGGIAVRNGQAVIASTEKGIDLGYVHFTSAVPDKSIPLKKILRKANEEDLKKLQENLELEIKARKSAQDEAKKLKLKMTFQVCKYSLDRRRATLYFTSDKRVDFRELVKNLAGQLHLRIELWQIGSRDETRLFGGIGPCNRELCCSLFYNSRESVTVRDAKAQGLDINPQKITGMCGKLMCCLKFEVKDYIEKLQTLPSNSETVRVGEKEGRVQKVNPFVETVVISFPDFSVQSFHASEVMRNIVGKWVPCKTETEKKEKKVEPLLGVSFGDNSMEVKEVKETKSLPVSNKTIPAPQEKKPATKKPNASKSPFPEPDKNYQKKRLEHKKRSKDSQRQNIKQDSSRNKNSKKIKSKPQDNQKKHQHYNQKNEGKKPNKVSNINEYLSKRGKKKDNK